MAIILTRHTQQSTCMPGTVRIGERSFPTIEQKWNDNKPFLSCIPPGEYVLVPYRSVRYGRCFVAVNHDLNVYHSQDSAGRPEDGRFKCLYFHRGNYGHNFEGCGGVGRKWIPAQQMITNTRETCNLVNQMIEVEGSFRLIIENDNGK